MANKNFEVKHGLSVGGTERISSAGVITGSLASAITATTQSALDNSTKIATTAYTDAAITAVIGGAPGTLDTLNELAAAINDDASYATTLTTALATKLPLAGGTLTGTLNVTGDGEDVIINSSDYELMLLGNRGASGSNLDKAYLRMKSEGTNTIILDTSGSTFFNGGNVGIKMANTNDLPQQTLHVGGSGASIYLGNNSADTNFIHTGGCLSLTADTDVYIVCDSNETSATPAGAGSIIFGGGSSTNTDNNLNFTEAEFGNNGAARVEYGRFHSNGFFGLNTTPGVELDLKRKTNAYPFRIGSESGQGRAMVFADVASTPSKYNWLVGSQYNVDNAFEITPSTAVGGYTFTGGTGITVTHTGNVGIGEIVPLGKLHVKEGDSGQGSVNANFDKLVLEDSSHSGMTILGGANTHGAIYFGDPNSNDIGQMKYKHDSDSMAFTQSGHETVLLTHTGAYFKGLNSYTLTINADTDNSGEDGIPTLDFKMDGAVTRLKMGVGADNEPYISTQSDIALPLKIKTGTSGNNRVYINDTGMQISDGTAAAPDHMLQLVHEGDPVDDRTFISIQNGTGTGDIGTPESHIDFEFFDSNSNEFPQVRLSAGAGSNVGVNADAVQKEGMGWFAIGTGDGGAGNATEVDPTYNLIVPSTGYVEMPNLGAGSGEPTVLWWSAGGNGGMLIRNSSSRRYKKDEKPTTIDSSKIYNLNAVDFKWNDKSVHPDKEDWGMIAEDVIQEIPELGTYNADSGQVEGVQYDKLSILLLEEIKKLNARIEELEK